MTANLLTVDYGMGMAQELGEALAQQGIKWQGVDNNRAALRYLMEYQPHLVLIDLASGSNTGYVLAVILKSQKRCQAPRVIGITSAEDTFLPRLTPGFQLMGIDRCISVSWSFQRRLTTVQKALLEKE
jgi:PleD family two-component response regulator